MMVLPAVYCCRKLNNESEVVAAGVVVDISMMELVGVVVAVAARGRLGKKPTELFPAEVALHNRLSVMVVAVFCAPSLMLMSVNCGFESTGGTVAEMIWYLK